MSNARRIIFTALSAVSFWGIASAAYVKGCSGSKSIACAHWFGASVASSSLPLMFLSLAVHNTLVKLGDPWVVVGGLFISGSVAFSFLTGVAQTEHQVSWLWVLFPMIAITSLVICQSWKRSVRVAEVEAVHEDER